MREAVQKLAWQGLIHVQARVGLQIAEIRPEDHQYVMQYGANWNRLQLRSPPPMPNRTRASNCGNAPA